MGLSLVPNEKSEIDQKEVERQIVESIAKGECTIPEDIVKKFGIPYDKVINLFSNPNFTNLIANYTKARLNMNFHTKSITKLMDISNSDDNKEALAAIKLIAQLTQNLKGVSSTDVNINIGLEGLVKEAEKNVSPFDVDFRRVNDNG